MLNRRRLRLLEDRSWARGTLAVYDFDHTLVYTPTPEDGEPAYRAATGKPWPFAGWWGEAASLLPPLTWRPIKRIVGAFLKAQKEPQTRAVVITGRPARPDLISRVKSILGGVGVHVEPGRDLFLKPIRVETLSWKLKQIQNLLHQMPKVRHLEVWEDRPDHAKLFRTHDFNVPGLTVDVHLVKDRG